MPTPLQSPFLSDSWLKNCGAKGFVFMDVCALANSSLKGITATITPPWALDCGLTLKNDVEKSYESFALGLSKLKSPIIVVDLPPVCENSKGVSSAIVKQNTPSCIRVQWRHTRILDIPAKLPSNRRKQLNKAEREGINCEVVESWGNVNELHDISRNRKGLANKSSQLKTLLDAVATEDYSFAVEAKDSEGNCISSGGFIMVSDNRCLYAFGGQKRGANSAIASVAILRLAMKEAQNRGATEFDFGGSADPGVDRFYKEFGARSVPKARLVKVAWWLKPLLSVVRPDLC